jgi:hypothetical protein
MLVLSWACRHNVRPSAPPKEITMRVGNGEFRRTLSIFPYIIDPFLRYYVNCLICSYQKHYGVLSLDLTGNVITSECIALKITHNKIPTDVLHDVAHTMYHNVAHRLYHEVAYRLYRDVVQRFMMT